MTVTVTSQDLINTHTRDASLIMSTDVPIPENGSMFATEWPLSWAIDYFDMTS